MIETFYEFINLVNQMNVNIYTATDYLNNVTIDTEAIQFIGMFRYLVGEPIYYAIVVTTYIGIVFILVKLVMRMVEWIRNVMPRIFGI